MSVQDISIMSWNCRGLNNEVTKNMIRDTSVSIKARILCLQETKCSNWPIQGMQLLGNRINEKCIDQNSLGAAGGIATCWDTDLFDCKGYAQSKAWVWTQMRTV